MTGPPAGGSGLASRIAARWREEGWPDPGDTAVVAVSGGLDSLVLLHLLRFRLPVTGLRMIVAHFDHAMREGSAGDASWVRGVAGAWGLPFRSARAEHPPRSESEARRLRYRFLGEVMEREGSELLLTAHHADDQAETILFRVLRGTGVRGLAGMASIREGLPGGARGRLLRPLLDETRGELEAYAAGVGLRPRIDPTNARTDRARNRIRHELFPLAEEVHPGARSALLRMARNARRATEALDALLDPVVEGIVREQRPGAITVSRQALLSLPPAVMGPVARALARRLGIRLDEAGTEGILKFIRTGPSGGMVRLPGSARLVRDFDRLRLEREGAGSRRRTEEAGGTMGGADAPLLLSEAASGGVAEARLGGRIVRVHWGDASPGSRPASEGGARRVEAFDPEALAFPLSIRRWRAGDRVRGPAGSRKLKKHFGELRMSREERYVTPVVEDGRGEVIWVPGWFRAPVALPATGTRTWYLGIEDDGDS